MSKSLSDYLRGAESECPTCELMAKADTLEYLTCYSASPYKRNERATDFARDIHGSVEGFWEGELAKNTSSLFVEIEKAKAEALYRTRTHLKRYTKWQTERLLESQVSDIIREALTKALLSSLKRTLEEWTWSGDK